MNRERLGLGIEAGIGGVWSSAAALNAGQWRRLEEHYALLRRWNAKLNLIGSSTVGTAAVKHYGESLFLAADLPGGVRSVVDAGSGAGFPGFPLAVMYPNVNVLLIESDKRKAAFLRESCNLPNLKVVNGRMEEWLGAVDAVVTRAVDPRRVVRWAQDHAAHFGFLGATRDIGALSEGAPFLSLLLKALPWHPGSSTLWGTFHVKPS